MFHFFLVFANTVLLAFVFSGQSLLVTHKSIYILRELVKSQRYTKREQKMLV